MMADKPPREAERLEALATYGVFETDPEEGLDRIIAEAARNLGVPVVAVNLVGEDRQWIKSSFGVSGIRETSREIAFCAHTILGDEMLVISDVSADARFMDNPLVTGSPNVRFYAGRPLRTAEGHALGALCAVDTCPREPSEQMLSELDRFGARVMEYLERRKKSRA